MPAQRPSDAYSPLYFLASVGAGGVAISFFMWLMFWVPHPGRSVPVFEDIAAAFSTGGVGLQSAIIVAMAGIAVFVFLNLRSLFWNLRALSVWKHTDAFQKFRKTNAESQLMALPLALAMSINAAFVLGLVFVPGLWGVVEYLFPLAIAAFLAVGYLAFRTMGAFLGRVLTEGGFNCSANNSFGQVLPAFAFAMTGVGMAAPAALSESAAIAGTGLVLSTFFLMAAALIAAIAMILGFRSMMENGAAPDTAPTLLIIVPLITVLGILMLRQNHGLGVHFGAHPAAGENLALLSKFMSVEILFLMFGGLMLLRQGYLGRFVLGRENSAGAYALVCPGVALSVMTQFWLNNGLVAAGLVEKFGAVYWVISALAIASQLAMVWLLLHLNRRHFGAHRAAGVVPAE